MCMAKLADSEFQNPSAEKLFAGKGVRRTASPYGLVSGKLWTDWGTVCEEATSTAPEHNDLFTNVIVFLTIVAGCTDFVLLKWTSFGDSKSQFRFIQHLRAVLPSARRETPMHASTGGAVRWISQLGIDQRQPAAASPNAPQPTLQTLYAATTASPASTPSAPAAATAPPPFWDAPPRKTDLRE